MPATVEIQSVRPIGIGVVRVMYAAEVDGVPFSSFADISAADASAQLNATLKSAVAATLMEAGFTAVPSDVTIQPSVAEPVAAADPRLSDARAPLPHTHPASEIIGLPAGSGGGKTLALHPPYQAASAAATNLAAGAFNAVGDPNYRWMTDLRGLGKLQIQGRIGGSLVAATKLKIQYHLGGPAVATGDAGWLTLADSAGSHAVNVMFQSAEIVVPAAAQVNNVLLRVGLFDGNGTADPTLSCAILNFYV